MIKTRIFFICMAFSLALFSCAGGAGGSGGGAETATLAINTGSRAVDNKYAKDDIVTFTVTISSGSFTSTKSANKGETMTFSNLPAGDYSVKAYGKTSNGNIAAKCETSVKVVSGETTTTILHLLRLEYCTVKFFNGSTEISSVQVTNGYTVEKPVAPTSEGHTFSGWSTEPPDATSRPLFSFNTQITADSNLYAVWDAVPYTITYVSEAKAVTADEYTTDAPFTLPEPEKDDLTFAGWYMEDDFSGTRVYTLSAGNTGAKTYYAKWTAAVTFDSQGGTAVTSPQTVTYNDKATAPATPTKSGMAFLGWYTGTVSGGSVTLSDTAYDFDTAVTENLTLYAKWGVTSFSGTVEQFLATEFANTSTETTPYSITITDVSNSNLSSVIAHLGTFSVISEGVYTKELWSNLTLQGSLTVIPNSAFSTSLGNYSMGKIVSISLPDSVRSIGTYAFYGMSRLGGITLPAHLETIEQNAFRYMGSSLGIGISINIPASVTRISASAFEDSQVTSITVDGTNAWQKNGSGATEELDASKINSSNAWAYTR